MKTEEDLLKEGWKKEMLCIHVLEYDGQRRNKLSYDMRNDFTGDQIHTIKAWANEVNNRMANIKISITGTGLYKPEHEEESDATPVL